MPQLKLRRNDYPKINRPISDLIFRLSPFFFLGLLFNLLCSSQSWAGDVSIDVDVRTHGNAVYVAIRNTGKHAASNVGIDVEIDNRRYKSTYRKLLAAGSAYRWSSEIVLPEVQGTYPVITQVNYLNDGAPAGIVAVTELSLGTVNHLAISCPRQELRLRDVREVTVPNFGVTVDAITPAVVGVETLSRDEKETVFKVSYLSPMLAGRSTIYYVYSQLTQNGLMGTKICGSNATFFRSNSVHSSIPLQWLEFGAILGLLFGLWLWRLRGAMSEVRVAAARALFSFGVVSFFLYFSRVAGEGAIFSLELLTKISLPFDGQLRPALKELMEWFFFEGGNYDPFFKWIADPLWYYFAFGNFFVLRFLIKPNPEREKNCLLMTWVKAGLLGRWQRCPESWAAGAWVGALALCVKLFYVPYLSSWTYLNVERFLFRPLELPQDPIAISKMLIDLLIFIDVSIFAVGYLVELPQLKNTIRSVEPTLFGWFICLVCYPPFNSIFYFLLEKPITHLFPPTLAWGHPALHFSIVFLWAIYCWATIALGMKSSNLTNRGTVASGPYRYIRHPAYASKVSVWILSSIYMGTMSVAYSFVLAVIYSLRAWTEERHLSADPDYLAYKERVRYRAIPGLF